MDCVIRLEQLSKRFGSREALKGISFAAVENLEFYAHIYGIDDNRARIERLLDLVGLKVRARERAGTFSRGMRQRLAVARALVHDPEVLIMDEPTSGIDPSGQIEFRAILLEVVRNESKTVFLSSHNLDEVQRICNRIALIDGGEIRLFGELKTLMRDSGTGEVVVEISREPSPQLLDELAKASGLGIVVLLLKPRLSKERIVLSCRT